MVISSVVWPLGLSDVQLARVKGWTDCQLRSTEVDERLRTAIAALTAIESQLRVLRAEPCPDPARLAAVGDDHAAICQAVADAQLALRREQKRVSQEHPLVGTASQNSAVPVREANGTVVRFPGRLGLVQP
ncbi:MULTISPECIES: hypothetical protein [unclassified Crossiella]|uniref:hypothetical protein n=1 Tax=unclassified Crossiella TaxID=2620835 RepID=UPI001FFFBD55|nr:MULTISPECIES: hypothetical protein [unclassified Crossiella]MCK2245256.1 hypothetical protein [Crossiella sp. S99.2]MCK2258909.1 hypothetical protein [Crossiella sp. S99.1]